MFSSCAGEAVSDAWKDMLWLFLHCRERKDANLRHDPTVLNSVTSVWSASIILSFSISHLYFRDMVCASTYGFSVTYFFGGDNRSKVDKL